MTLTTGWRSIVSSLMLLFLAVSEELKQTHRQTELRFIVSIRAAQLILTKVQLDKFSISRSPVKFMTCNDKNKTIIISKYRKILGFYLGLHTLH